MRIISETVEWHAYTPGSADAHGNPVDAWGTPTTVGIYAFNPGGSTEPHDPGMDRVVTSPTVYLPAGVVFNPRDRVTVRGVLYEVEGATAVWKHPDGSQRGNVANLRRVDG